MLHVQDYMQQNPPTSCWRVMPHSRLKASSSSVAGASCVFCFSLRAPLSEFDLPLRLPFRSSPLLFSSSVKLWRVRLGDIVRIRVLFGGMRPAMLYGQRPGLAPGLTVNTDARLMQWQ